MSDFTIDPPEVPQVVTPDDGGGFGLPPVPGDGFGAGEGDAFGVGELDDAPEATEATIRLLLTQCGRLGNTFGHDEDVPDQWKFTAEELEAIVPPLTRIVNRRRVLRVLVARGDGLFVTLAMGGYFARNIEDGRIARKERGEEEDHGELAGQAGGAGAGGEAQGAAFSERRDGGSWGAGVHPDEVAGVGHDAGG